FKIIYLEENIGRSKIRNILIKNSRYNLIMFIDGDSKIKSNTFIKDYLSSANQADLIYGGRSYEDLTDNNCKLHWLYGTKTESVSDNNFHSNNFLIKRYVTDIVLFNESLNKYGYEDAVFGVKVSLNGFKIKKINNPVIHAQLKDNKQFLNDTI